MPSQIAPHTTLTVQAGTRPLRVAYLIDPDLFDGEGVDAITESAMGHWGGRYRGLFPLSGGQIPAACWPVLEALDPDAIVSLQPLEDAVVKRLTRRVLPFEILTTTIEPPHSPGGRWTFRDPTNGVDVYGVPQTLAQSIGAATAPRILNLHEHTGRNPHRSFILRNFGLYPSIVLAQSAMNRAPHVDLLADEFEPANLLRVLAQMGYDTVSPLALSALECPFLQLPFTHDGGFDDLHIITGSSVRDAMLAWNRALHTGGLQRHRTLWVPLTLLAHADFQTALTHWLSRTGRREGDFVRLVSYEHQQEQLEPVALNLRRNLHSVVQCCSLAPDTYPFPPLQGVGRRWINFGDALSGTRKITEHVNFADGVGSMAVALPPLFDPRYNQSEWMIDVAIPHRPEQYGFTNVRPIWTLPKRLSLGPSFFQGIHKARITSIGIPSASFSSTVGRLDLRIPSDRELFDWCLAPRQVVYGGGDPPRSMFSDYVTSSAGRALRGMLQVFGGLYQASRVFEDPFWRDTLLYMSGERHAAAQERKQRLEAALREFLESHGAIDAASPSIPPLAERLSRSLTPSERRRLRLTPSELKQRFVQVRNASLGDPAFGNYWEAQTSFDDVQVATLEFLLDAGVLLLGIEARCPQCGVQHWIKVDELAARVACPGCTTPFPLSPEPAWCYQLNDLVGVALRTAGCLAVLQALLQVGQWYFHEPFVFLPPQDVFREPNGAAFTDIDLLCLCDGELVLGEVKSRAAGFRRHDLETIEQVARAVVPDKVVFASPPGDWQADALARLGELTADLAELDIRVEKVELRWL